jgi:mercuric ion transport protein
VRDPRPKDQVPKGSGAAVASLTGVGGAVAAVIAGACCVGPVMAPLFVSVLGAGGAAWAAGLKPYSPYILAGSLALIAFGFWRVYRRNRMCKQGLCSPSPRPVWISLWIALVLWSGAAVANVVFRVLSP